MKWIELLRKGNISLLQSQSDTQYCVCSNFNESAPEDQQYYNGEYFCYWDNKDIKPIKLFAAVDYFRSRTEDDYVSYSRLTELATYFKDGLLEDDKESAMEYFDACDMEDYEKDLFKINRELSLDETSYFQIMIFYILFKMLK